MFTAKMYMENSFRHIWDTWAQNAHIMKPQHRIYTHTHQTFNELIKGNSNILNEQNKFDYLI